MADWEARFAKEKKGLMVVIVNTTSVRFAKSQELIEGGKVVVPPPPYVNPGEVIKFGIVMKSTKQFQFQQQWTATSGENALFSVLLNKGGGRAIGNIKPGKIAIESVSKFERLAQKLPAMVQFSLVEGGGSGGKSDATFSVPESSPAVPRKSGGGKDEDDESSSWTSSEEAKPKMKVVIKPESGNQESGFDATMAALGRAPSKSQSKRGKSPSSPASPAVSRNIAGLSEEEQMRLAIEESKRSEREREERDARLKEEAALQEAMKRSLAEPKKAPVSEDDSSDETPSAAPSGQNPKELCWQFLQQGIALVDQGKFQMAIPLLTQSVGVLVANPNAHTTFKAELAFAANYLQAAAFLLELQRLQAGGYVQQMALVANRLADIEVQPNHRLTHARMSIKLGNFGSAARLLRLLVPAGLPEKDLLETMLKECEKNGFKDLQVPTGAGTRLCFKTFRLIRTRQFSGCEFCKATYRPQLLTNCVYCNNALSNVSD